MPGEQVGGPELVIAAVQLEGEVVQRRERCLDDVQRMVILVVGDEGHAMLESVGCRAQHPVIIGPGLVERGCPQIDTGQSEHAARVCKSLGENGGRTPRARAGVSGVNSSPPVFRLGSRRR